MAENLPKIIQIGFNKTGTQSLWRLMHDSGIKSLHWEWGELARKIKKNILDGIDPFEGYDEFQFFSDIEYTHQPHIDFIEGYKFFKVFHRHHPDAIFILTTRNRDRWIASRLRQEGGNYIRHYMYHWGMTRAQVIERWEEEWDRFHADVKSFFGTRDARFITFNVEEDHVQKIAQALSPDYTIDAEAMPHVR